MDLLKHIEEQMATIKLPLIGVTIAAVPYANTPVVMSLHWHGLSPTKLANTDNANPIAYRSIPSSALQINSRWDDLESLDLTTMEAAWELGAWDMARIERKPCLRIGADTSESFECLQAFGNYPFQIDGETAFISNTPDVEDLVEVAARSGYLTWTFRPVRGGLWKSVSDDATLDDDGRRKPPCPYLSEPTSHGGNRKTIYRFGKASKFVF